MKKQTKKVKKSKVNHDYTCDDCSKPAKFSTQAVYIDYSIDKEGNFEEIDSLPDESSFYCEKCWDKRNAN